MVNLMEMIVAAILLYVGAGFTLFSPLWWVALILGAFAVLLTLGAIGLMVDGRY